MLVLDPFCPLVVKKSPNSAWHLCFRAFITPLKPFLLLDNSFLAAERQMQKKAQQGRNWKVSVSGSWAWFSNHLFFSTDRWHTRKFQFYLVHFYDGEIVHSSLFFLRACECGYTAELSEIYLCGCVCGCVCVLDCVQRLWGHVETGEPLA